MVGTSESATSRFLVIFLISLLLVINGASSRATNHQVRHPQAMKMHKISSENKIRTAPMSNPISWFRKFYRLLRGQDSVLGKPNASLTKSTHQENTAEQKKRYDTSCGEITCDHVEDYPEKLIRELYIKQYGIKNNSQIEERSVPNENATPDPPVYGDWLQSFSASFPDKVDSNKNSENFYLSSAATGSIDSIENILTKKYFSNFNSASASRHVIDTPCDTSSRCDRMTEITFPQEGLDSNGNRILVVNIGNIEVIKSWKCEAPKKCVDKCTREGYVNYCEPNIQSIHVKALDKRNHLLYETTMSLPLGCKCEERKERKDD